MTNTEGRLFLEDIVGWSIDHPQRPIVRYAAATLAIVAVALFRALLVTSILPWLLFVPAILLIGLILAQGPAIYASVLAAGLAAWSIGSRAQPWWLTGPQWVSSVLFLVVAIGLSFFAGALRAGLRRVRRVTVEFADRAAFLSGVLASSTDCIKVLNLDGRLTFMSEGGMRVMEVDDFNTIKGCPWPDFWEGAGNARAQAAIEAARRGESSHFIGKANTYLGTPKWWDVSVSAIPGADGGPERILSVSRDTTALMMAQEQQRLLNDELGHRLKNILTLVQSIANQTFRDATSVESASAAFSSRLSALGKATDVLTATAWRSATVRDVAGAGLTSLDGFRDRVTLDGPDIELGSQLALALTLSLHELMTNACKYGALSNDEGTIAISWTCDQGHKDDDGRFTFRWRERGGPLVSPPTRQGFGSRMIKRSLQAYVRGETALVYDPAGVIFTIDAPMPKTGVLVGE